MKSKVEESEGITKIDTKAETNLNMENVMLEITTCQTNSFKLISEALKEALKDINIKFSKAIEGVEDSGGLSIVAYNPRSAVLIKVKIPAKSFDKFYINPPNGQNDIQIGVNMKSFNTLMKTARNQDNISLMLNDDDKNHLTFIFENGESKIRSRYNLKLLELEDEGIHLPTTQFPFKIIIQSDDFHKIIRDASALSDKLNIKFINTKEITNTIIFSSEGDFANSEITLTDDTEGVQIIKNMEEDAEIVVKGSYPLANLSLFSKCQTLCGCVELYLKNNFPLIIKYQVANLGHVLLVLSTVSNENILDEDDSEEEN
jgi:proliferating cell nuclear antigen